MKLIITSIVAMVLIAGCGYSEGDEVDNSVHNITYGTGTVLDCTNSECKVSNSQDPSDGDAVVGIYDPEYTQTECNAAGYFYCTIEQACLNIPLEGGSCTVHTEPIL